MRSKFDVILYLFLFYFFYQEREREREREREKREWMNITNYIREDFNSSSIYFSNQFASFQRDELTVTSQCYRSFVFQVHDSTQRTVLLRSVNLSSTGRYRCEVSAEAPSFQTVSDHSDMTVIGKDRWRFVIVKNFISHIFV